MFLKKEFLHLPCLQLKSFSIVYEDTKDLTFGIIDLCEWFKKDVFLVEIFARDLLNEKLSKECKNVGKYKNFNYYLIENINMIAETNLENVRLLSIYAVEKDFFGDNISSMIKSSPFILSLDNYLEDTKITINYNKYDDLIISTLPMK